MKKLLLLFLSFLGLPVAAQIVTSFPTASSITGSEVIYAPLFGTDQNITPAMLKAYIVPSFSTLAITGAGDNTLTPTALINVVAVTESAGSAPYTATITLSHSGAVQGEEFELKISSPASANPVLQIYDGTTSGSLLSTPPSSLTAGNTTITFAYTGSAWITLNKGAYLIASGLAEMAGNPTLQAAARTNLGVNATTATALTYAPNSANGPLALDGSGNAALPGNLNLTGSLNLTGGLTGTIYLRTFTSGAIPTLGVGEFGVTTDAATLYGVQAFIGNATGNVNLSKPFSTNIQTPAAVSASVGSNASFSAQPATGANSLGGAAAVVGGSASLGASFGATGGAASVTGGSASAAASVSSNSTGGVATVAGGAANANASGDTGAPTAGNAVIIGGVAVGNSSATATGGDATIDGGNAAGGSTNVPGRVKIGGTYASAIQIGRTGITSTVYGPLVTGNITLNPTGSGGSGTNSTLSFGNGYGNEAALLYDGGAGHRYGWGLNAGEMQFFAAPASPASFFSFCAGGDLNATGVNEAARLYSANGHLQLGGLASGDLGYMLDVNGTSNFIGKATFSANAVVGYLQGQGGAPTIAAGVGAGTSPTVAIIGTNLAGEITLTTGTSPTASATLATITLANSAAYTNHIEPMLAPENSNAANLSGTIQPYCPQGGTTTWTISSNGTALTASTTYVFHYTCTGY